MIILNLILKDFRKLKDVILSSLILYNTDLQQNISKRDYEIIYINVLTNKFYDKQWLKKQRPNPYL